MSGLCRNLIQKYLRQLLPQWLPDRRIIHTIIVLVIKVSFTHAGEAIGDFRNYIKDRTNLCKEQWAAFSCAEAFKLVSWFIERKVSKIPIIQYFSSGIGNSILDGSSSMHTLENHLWHLDRYSQYLQWCEGHVEDGQSQLPFFYRDILDCFKYLVRQIGYHDALFYAPCCEYD